MKIFNFLSAFLILSVLFPGAYRVSAVIMDSSRFKIESTEVGVTNDEDSPKNYTLADTAGQLVAGQFMSNGYVVKSGYQYPHSTVPFRFTISNVNIAFGALIASKPTTASSNLTVYFNGPGQYQVTAVEEGVLKTQSERFVPDTNCNGGNNTCSSSLARIWTSTSAYGFGYNMSGEDVPADFIDPTYFRPFPDQTKKNNPVVIMNNVNISKNRQSTITLKANISSIQQAGSYQTVINFLAAPSY